jgi:hypothetical protein
MIPLILGAVALGATGYGVNKLVTDEDFRDSVKDKIQDGAFKAVDGLDWLEEKMGLNEYTFSKKDIEELKDFKESGKLGEFGDTFNDITNFILSSSIQTNKTGEENNPKDDFIHLHKMKLAIYDKLSNPTFEKSKIKLDKTNDVEITDEIQYVLNSYAKFLKKAFISYSKQQADDEQSQKYLNIIQELSTTKIIKKGKLNTKATDAVLSATRVFMGAKEEIFVELDV